MHTLLWFSVFVAAIIGHMSFWVGAFNRLHGTRLNNRILRRGSYPVTAFGIVGLPVAIAVASYFFSNETKWTPSTFKELNSIWGAYLCFCLGMFVVTLTLWIKRQIFFKVSPLELVEHRTLPGSFREIANKAERNSIELFFASIPGNQIYECHIEERTIHLSGICPSFNGLTITHLSDFHLTGNICREYFQQVITRANELDSDLIAITGDVIDSSKCWDWIKEDLSKLSARLGVFYILGNHDERMGNEKELRDALNSLGMIGVADRWISIPFGEKHLHLGGNERPWFGNPIALESPPPSSSDGDFRLLLSHSPDQWKWARKQAFNLVLAGHTHGGQIRIPLVGPIISPSLYGVKYASGLFTKEQKVMVVSRGISGEEPIRLNCPPEIGKITISTTQ